jgi:hypothetical protein
MQLFGGERRKALAQVKPHLITEHTLSAGAGTVTFDNSVLQNMAQQVVVLLHLLFEFLQI